jgi:hypothetical protein
MNAERLLVYFIGLGVVIFAGVMLWGACCAMLYRWAHRDDPVYLARKALERRQEQEKRERIEASNALIRERARRDGVSEAEAWRSLKSEGAL